MSFINEQYHSNRLNKYNINIKTTYKDNNLIFDKDSNKPLLETSQSASRIEKKYFKDDVELYKTNDFDPRIKYDFSFDKCPNCGFDCKSNDSYCEYCGTYYSINYNIENLSSEYIIKQLKKNIIYKVGILLLDIIISLIFMYFYIKGINNFFNILSILKTCFITLGFGFIIYYFSYLIDAFLLIIPIKMYKNKQNDMQIEFWNTMKNEKIDKCVFLNNLNYELQKYYYSDEYKLNDNVIDYDIVEFKNFKSYEDNNLLKIEVDLSIRIIKYIDNEIISDVLNKKFILQKYNKKVETSSNEINIVRCHECGDIVDLSKGKCEKCNKKYNYKQIWYLVR